MEYKFLVRVVGTHNISVSHIYVVDGIEIASLLITDSTSDWIIFVTSM